MEWTKEQEQAINKENSNLLVAAAAGSGKTAVLVERIINKIINENVDIDKLLVVTFTNAAAAEMRERILSAIYKKINEIEKNLQENMQGNMQGNAHQDSQDRLQGNAKREEQEKIQEELQRQIILLNKANICTIDSFCLDVIRNNFFEIDVSPNFRIEDTAEMELLKQEVLEELFEEKYETEDENFQKLIKTYTSYRDDTDLKDLIIKIYTYISSSPYPRKWLNEQIEKFNIVENIDFAQTEWGKILIKEVQEELIDDISILKSEAIKLSVEKELEIFKKTIENDIYELEKLLNNLDNWDKAYNIANSVEFITWPRNKTDLEEKENAKKVRDTVKKKFRAKIDKIFVSDSAEALQDIRDMYKILTKLKNLIFEFDDRFLKKKKEKNVLDFVDIEHKALKILVNENEDGTHTRSEVAKRYQEKFQEIAIDEYQDSNLVQEYILTAVSRNNNIFMVGDVKQSIYRFRQARPELFLDKYKKYSLEKANNDGLKIQLFKNFRSRENILEFTNTIFQNIMSEELGDIDYTEEEYLNFGADFGTNEQQTRLKNEIDIININEEEEELTGEEIQKVQSEQNGQEVEIAQSEDEQEEQIEKIEDIEIEAKFVAQRIKELVENKFQVYDMKKKEYRDIKYKDIVILLRSTKTKAPIFEKELLNRDIPVYSDMSSEYLDSVEIQTILSLLKIIDNPMQDIPLVSVLRSSIGNFTDNELVEIRLADEQSDFYTAMQKAKLSVSTELKNKIERFFEKLDSWREKQEYLSLDELIWTIYEETNFLNYVGILPNGSLRQANLKMLFERAKQYEAASFKGLFNFIKFIEKLKLGSGDLSSAKMIGENEDVVRIMSIHKSKGLEFPIVFLASAGTNFNLTDLNSNILLDQELGLGVKYINYDMQIKYDTLTKQALRNKEFSAILAEEMRILYVALTRAKEKLYITGISKDYEKSKQEKEDFIKMYENKNGKINPILVKKYKSYLDWIELVYFSDFDKMSSLADLNIFTKNELIEKMKPEEKEEIDVLRLIDDNLKYVTDDEVKKIEEELNFKYRYLDLTKITSKTSITAIAHKDEEALYMSNINEEEYLAPIEPQEEVDYREEEVSLPVPKFLNGNEEEVVTPAKRGTVVHLCMKNLDFSKEYELQDVKELIQDLVNKALITEKEATVINTIQILQFTKSIIWKELKEAKKYYKEEPFYINVPINEVIDIAEEEEMKDHILAQGIIDLYYIDKNNDIVLVDYKTDFVKNGEEDVLVQRHSPQLKLYKEALENALGKKVSKVYIYSTVLGKEIKVDI